MRITNKMMTNNSLSNINKNKIRLNDLDQQYSTGKKIQRPSDDPIIAVRALKLRTTVSEIDQYYNKNIPDAMSWMEVTESALTNINSILTNIHTQFDQGANGTYNKSDLDGIVKNLQEMKSQIYQEGNTNYAGRYVFTGYKTNTSLIFNEQSLDTQYTITEKFSGKDIDTVTTITDSYKVADYVEGTSTVDDFTTAPNIKESYRIRLSYDKLDSAALDPDELTYTITDNSTTPPTKTVARLTDPPLSATVALKSITDEDAYVTDDDIATPIASVNFIPETGELILSKAVYNALRLNEDSEISIDYSKTKFAKGDLRPEHYFDCTTIDTLAVPADTGTTYTIEDQDIQYEITFNQKLTINTQGKDSITHTIDRVIDELAAAVEDVTLTEGKIEEIEKLLENPETTDDQKDVLNKFLEQLNTELVLKEDILKNRFESGLTSTEKYQDKLSITVADSGSRYVRLELTESRLDSQLVDSKELMSNNEDADIAEVIINYTSAESIYNSSLNAASKIVKNTLLDFI